MRLTIAADVFCKIGIIQGIKNLVQLQLIYVVIDFYFLPIFIPTKFSFRLSSWNLAIINVINHNNNY